MARQNMLNASAMACNAVQADFGAAPVHNFAHAIGALFHIHHGEANAVFLPTVLEEMPEFYCTCRRALERQHFAVQATEPKAIVLESAAVIRRLMAEMGHPQDLSPPRHPRVRLAGYCHGGGARPAGGVLSLARGCYRENMP